LSANYVNLFRQDPVRFVNNYTVDIKGWFEGLMNTPKSHGLQYFLAAGEVGSCRLDFDPAGGVLGWGIDLVTAKMVAHGGVEAY
jgi:hypothetical protein